MAVLLLKLIFLVITSTSSLITGVIFSTLARLLVLVIHGFKVPGESIKGGLEQLADAIRDCVGYVFGIILEAIGSLISYAVGLVIEAVAESALKSGSAIGGLVEKWRESLDGLLKSLPDIIQGTAEMVYDIVAGLWSNYIDALEYVTENA